MGEHICFRRNERLATVNPYWRGNPMVRGRFFNRQHRFRPGMGSVLKWRLSPNPQRKEKKTVKFDQEIISTFHDGNRIGFVFDGGDSGHKYLMKV